MLWYEESLPPDTVLYVGLYAQAARVKGGTMTAAEVLEHVITDLFARPYLQLDGVTRSDLDAYLAAQAEALLFLDWVKKLARAFLARDEETTP